MKRKILLSIAVLIVFSGIFFGDIALNKQVCFAEEGTVTVETDGKEYKNLEAIPGQEPTGDLVKYLNSLYRFGLAISGILAAFMIAVGAFIYIVTSAGNASKKADAKDIITDALIGLILAFVAYLILYIINPDLVKGTFKAKTAEEITQEQVYAEGNKFDKESTDPDYHKACPASKGNDETEAAKPINYNLVPPSKSDILSDCNQYDKYFEAYKVLVGGDACLLKAIAAVESKCGSRKENSGKDACGLMQLKVSTVGKSCEELIKNDDLSVKKAAEYIGKNITDRNLDTSSIRGIAMIMAGYNSGYAATTSDGKKASLAISKDCPSPPDTRAFECCIDPGGLDESIGYAYEGIGYYKACKGITN